MPSPQQVSNFPAFKTNNVKVSTLVGDDNELVDHIIKLARSEDDPPIVFGWDMRGLEEFWHNAVAYGATAAAVAPPNQINGGVQLVGPATGAGIRDLQVGIFNFLRAQLDPTMINVPAVFGETAGIACSINQFANVNVQLALLQHNPWVAAVLVHGGALAHPLGTIWHPRPRVASGICDQIIGLAPLWQ